MNEIYYIGIHFPEADDHRKNNNKFYVLIDKMYKHKLIRCYVICHSFERGTLYEMCDFNRIHTSKHKHTHT